MKIIIRMIYIQKIEKYKDYFILIIQDKTVITAKIKFKVIINHFLLLFLSYHDITEISKDTIINKINPKTKAVLNIST